MLEPSGDAERHVTFCRICEAHCGMVATVRDGRVEQLRPDRDHPLSKGYACPKGIAMVDVQNDPDRVLHPLRRRPSGDGFERVSWEVAITDISERVRRILDERGADAVGWYMGNPGAFSFSHTLWVKGFLDAIGSTQYYTAGSQDVNNRFAASALLYGSPLVVPIPDLKRTSFLLMVGANPLVSHGSVLTAPRVRDQLNDIVRRGGRVVVIDPRRSETARAFEHLPIEPDADAWLLLSMLHVLFAEGLADQGALSQQATEVERLRALVSDHPPEQTAARTGIDAETVRALTRDLARADGAAVYGRTGSCLGRFGTLVAFLLDALNVATGNLDRPGGAVFGRPAIALDEVGERTGLATYGKVRSRIGDFPDVIGNLPATLLPREITTPGDRQIRALFVSAGNPVLSVPDGEALEDALEQLDLCVSLDFYVNETNRHADYVLPAPTWLERSDVPAAFLGFYTTPFIQHADAVVPPAGEAREEWEVIDDISRRLGVVPASAKQLRWLGRLGVRLTPDQILDALLRTGPDGDWFGLRRGGLSLAKLRKHPHGIVMAEHVPTGVLREKVRHGDRRVRLAPDAIAGEIARLCATDGNGNGRPADFPLKLIGLRELRSHNSWMHNAPLLMRGGRTHAARVHPQDAEALGLTDGGRTRIVSRHGAIEVEVTVTEEIKAGTVALPHGWGHRNAGWRLANEHGGANINVLMGSAPEDLEPLAGMAHLNGVPIRLEPIPSSAASATSSASESDPTTAPSPAATGVAS
jgi:anaerobic selenocysteine-containing dehydrogenase